MADGAEVCGMTMGAGALFGTLAGLGVGIWVAVDFIQPALAKY